MTDARIFELTYIECSSGISTRKPHEPFIRVRCMSKEGHVVIGQMDHQTARKVGLQFLEAAEAAVSDAAVFAVVTEDLELDSETAARLVSALRDHRADKDEGDQEP